MNRHTCIIFLNVHLTFTFCIKTGKAFLCLTSQVSLHCHLFFLQLTCYLSIYGSHSLLIEMQTKISICCKQEVNMNAHNQSTRLGIMLARYLIITRFWYDIFRQFSISTNFYPVNMSCQNSKHPLLLDLSTYTKVDGRHQSLVFVYQLSLNLKCKRICQTSQLHSHPNICVMFLTYAD